MMFVRIWVFVKNDIWVRWMNMNQFVMHISTGRIWNVGDIVEAKGVSGKVIRKGTNYIAFHDEDGKVHKAWLHEIELDEALPIKVTVKDKSGKTHTTSTIDLRGATHALLIHYKEIPAVKGNLPGSKESKPPKTDIPSWY